MLKTNLLHAERDLLAIVADACQVIYVSYMNPLRKGVIAYERKSKRNLFYTNVALESFVVFFYWVWIP